MFKLILILSFLDAGGEPQQQQMQYAMFFDTIAECQEQARNTMQMTEDAIAAGAQVYGVSYTCLYDPNLIGAETDA